MKKAASVFHLVVVSFMLFIQSESKDLQLTILHTNDVHSRFLQASKLGGTCLKEDEDQNLCYGGFARLHHKVKEIRRTHPNVAYLSGGDYYQGTIWYTLHKWKVVSYFVNKLNHTAMALGNHEFDDKIEGLVPFLEAATFPIVDANIDDSLEPTLKGKLKKSIIVNYEGKKVGIIGYTTTKTPEVSAPGKNLKFEDEVTAINREAEKLNAQGVKILIALGHSGFSVDKTIAKEVPLIDVVVGGHSNTFLYTGSPPDAEIPLGDYPVVVTQENGKRVPVVQAYAFGKYLGYLNITVDENGDVKSWSGKPILMDASIPQDQEMLGELMVWNKNISEAVKRVVGQTRVLLEGTSMACRLRECSMGNLIADAMVHSFRDFHEKENEDSTTSEWSEVTLAVLAGGSVRTSISETSGNGSITLEDIKTILPFDNTVDIIEIKGKHLKQAFEYAMEGYDPKGEHLPGKFLQISGIHVVYDISKPDWSKVREMNLLCTQCRIPQYEPLDENKVYKVAIMKYTANGGDGFTVFSNNTIKRYTPEILDTDMLIDYVQAKSPITQGVDGRITFYIPQPCQAEQKSKAKILVANVILLIFTFLVPIF